MNGYRVHPAGVLGVLTAVTAAGTDIDSALRPLDTALQSAGSAADGTSGSDVISAALRAFDEHVSSEIDVVTTRLPAASRGLHGATRAVETGDEVMATQVRAAEAGALRHRAGNGRWMQ